MEITGKVIELLSRREVKRKDGSKDGSWGFVLEYMDGEYVRRGVFSVFGDERWQKFGLVVDGRYQVGYNLDARSWQGRWFNDLSVWRVSRLDGQQAAAPAPAANAGTTAENAPSAPAPTSAPAGDNGGQEDSDNLPF